MNLLIILVSLLIITISSNANAFILREYTLEEVVHACSNVMFGKVASIDPEKMCFVVEEIENIKGKEQFKQIKISVVIGQGNSPKQLMDKLRADIPIVIFYVMQGQKRIEALGYVSDVWIRLFAIHDNPKAFEWYFTHIEKYMNRTFDGNSLKLQSLIREILAEKRTPNSTNDEVKGLRSMLENLFHFFVKWFYRQKG